MSAKSAAIHEITESKNETIVSFFLSFVVVVVVVVVVVSAKLKSINAVCVCLQVFFFLVSGLSIIKGVFKPVMLSS